MTEVPRMLPHLHIKDETCIVRPHVKVTSILMEILTKSDLFQLLVIVRRKSSVTGRFNIESILII